MIASLSTQEQEAVERFAGCVLETYPSLIERITLFGSKARGGATDESDVDILVVLGDGSPEIEREIRRYAARVSLQFDVIISPLVLNRAAWEPLEKCEAPFFHEIETDGIDLMKKPEAA